MEVHWGSWRRELVAGVAASGGYASYADEIAVGGYGVSKGLPYYKMYPKDFDADENVRLLDAREVGVFIFALNHAWANNGLPNDESEIGRMLKISVRDFKHAWPRVSKCFLPSDDGRLRNPRQEKERTEAIQKGEKNKRPGNANASREKHDCVSQERDIPNKSRTNETPRGRGRADSDSSCGSDFKSDLQEVKDFPEFSNSEFPLTLRAVHQVDPAIDEMFVRRLVQTVLQECLSDESITKEQIEAISDEWIARAVTESLMKFRGKGPHGGGLLLSRVPQIIKTWCKED